MDNLLQVQPSQEQLLELQDNQIRQQSWQLLLFQVLQSAEILFGVNSLIQPL